MKSQTFPSAIWSLGIFEPLDQWDRLRPSSQGLTGVFGLTETRSFLVRFFITGLYLPEASPNVVLRGGRFAAEHPQATTSAPQTLSLLNRPTPMSYRILAPSLSKVLFRPGLAFSFENRAESIFHSKFSYAYLPLNHFPLALRAGLSIPLDQISVNLRPRLLQHHLYSSEISLRSGGVELRCAALIDDPVPDPIPVDETAAPSPPRPPSDHGSHGTLRLLDCFCHTSGHSLESDQTRDRTQLQERTSSAQDCFTGMPPRSGDLESSSAT